MGITRTIEKERDLTRLTAGGEVTAAETKEAIEQFWEAPELTMEDADAWLSQDGGG